jgi:nucleolar protein 56
MKALVTKSVIGYFAFSEKGELLYYKLFEPKPEDVEKTMNKPIPDDFLSKLEGYEVTEGKADKIMKERVRGYAISLGFVKSDEEFNNFLSRLALLISKKRMKSAIGRDRLIIQASCALDDMTKIVNLLFERIEEWYSLHYPELKFTQKNLDDVLKYGRRDDFPGFKESVGIELTESDEVMLLDYAKMVKLVSDEKNKLEKYIKSSMKEIAPNLSSLIDTLLAARLLSLAGSLEKLSRMTASTIQLLGAEKALFRHLRKKGKSPKYGILYNDSRIQNAEEGKRGKIARIISSKLMLAARLDFYSGRYEEKLKKELEEDIKNIG